jgi:23S rRNA pseudouridine2605 synthase
MEFPRIQKVIADSGYCSRRKAEALILANKVKVNGRPATIGMKVNAKKDLVVIDGETLKLVVHKQHKYLMLNKPRGYVTTMNDEQDRHCVAELVKDLDVRVFPIGRLDVNSEGLLLFTSDGDFANDISHPSRHVSKIYRVTVRPSVTDEKLIQMAEGIVIDDKRTQPCTVRVLAEETNRVVLEIVLKEGRNRQIRKMCEALGLEVARLKRTSLGPIKLGMLKSGKYRELTKEEIRSLRAASSKDK